MNFDILNPEINILILCHGRFLTVSQNFCHRSRCPGKYFLCQVGFTNKGYRCFCPEGFKGDRCDEGYVHSIGYNLVPRFSLLWLID